MINSTVFISYSHDSAEHADRVLALSDRLRAEGVDCILDQYETSPAEGWPRWMDKHIRAADFVVMVCTETYFRRVMGEETPGKGLGVKWEGNLIYNHIYNADSENTRFIPILFAEGEFEHIPTPLQGATHYRVDSPDGYEGLYRRLTNQPRVKKPDLGKLRPLAPLPSLPPRERKPDYLGIRVSTAKLPSTHPDLFGRERELAALDAAWDNPQVNVFSLVAWGGVGKTALANKWLMQMQADDYRGARRVYGWSFYSQGAAEGRQVSADQFIAAALAWFGAPDPTAGSPWDKGERLAELIRQERTLLILDGLEPLQNPPPNEVGKIKDPGLRSLLRELARRNPGLVLITTRLAPDDLKEFLGGSDVAATVGSAIEMNLENLSPEAGAAYLKRLGVEGPLAECEEAAREYRGHALALTLLGRYLVDVYDGEVRRRGLIPKLTDEEEQGAHAKRMMEAYEKWFEGKPEQNVLYLLGLFDRPAEGNAIKALSAPPAIEGLTERLRGLSNEKWHLVLKHLRKARLLDERDPDAPDTLDCHPLLREHFGAKLKASNPEAWREAHSRLYEYYKLSTKVFPDTIEEMTPLFAAVAHGCQAGRHQEAMDEVYWRRIRRGEEAFSVHKLGAFGADLVAVSGFFDPPWLKPVDELREDDKAFVLNDAGFDLRALGRPVEAAEPMQAGLEADIALKDWRNAARSAGNLSELTLTLGNLPQALERARRSVELADRGGDVFVRIVVRTVLSDTLHQAGCPAEAEDFFRQAEEMQKVMQPEFPLLYSLHGFRYCDLLLSQGHYQEVQHRAGQTLEWARQELGLLSNALDHLSLGRAHLLEAQSTLTPAPLPEGEGESSPFLLGKGQNDGLLDNQSENRKDRRNEEGIHPLPLGEGRGEGSSLGLRSDSPLNNRSETEPQAAGSVLPPTQASLSQAFTHLDCAVDGLRQAGMRDFIPRGLLARAELRRVTGALNKAQDDLDTAQRDFDKAQRDLDEAFEIATRSGMRLHEADCHLEFARLHLARDENDKAWERFDKAKRMIEEMGYHRRDAAVRELEAQV